MKFWVSSEADLGEEKLLKMLLVIGSMNGFFTVFHTEGKTWMGDCFGGCSSFWPVLVFVCLLFWFLALASTVSSEKW